MGPKAARPAEGSRAWASPQRPRSRGQPSQEPRRSRARPGGEEDPIPNSTRPADGRSSTVLGTRCQGCGPQDKTFPKLLDDSRLGEASAAGPMREPHSARDPRRLSSPRPPSPPVSEVWILRATRQFQGLKLLFLQLRRIWARAEFYLLDYEHNILRQQAYMAINADGIVIAEP